MLGLRVWLVILTASICGCRSSSDITPPEDMAIAAMDLKRSSRDMASMPSPDLRSQRPLEALWAKDLYERPSGKLWAAVAVDNSRNVLVANIFKGTIDLGGGPLKSLGSVDSFIVKYSADGKHLWSKRLGDSKGLTTTYAIAADSKGNIVIAGSFVGTTDLGGGPLVSDSDSADVFLAKYTADGNHIFSKRFGGSDHEFFLRIVLASGGDIFVAGVMNGSPDFGSGPLTSKGGQDIVVVRYTADGIPQWSKSFGGSGTDEATVAIDPSGDLIISGYFNGAIDLGGGLIASKGKTDGFIARYTQAGSYKWAKGFGEGDYDRIDTSAVDSQGNSITGGSFSGSIDLGGGPLTTSNRSGAFLAAHTPSGAHIWSRAYDAPSPNALAIDSGDHVFVAGNFSVKADFGGGVLTSAGQLDIYLASLSSTGDHLTSQRYGDLGSDSAESLVIDANNSAILAGSFAFTVDFGTGPLAGNEWGHSYVLKLKP